ncbi:hypothetical protein PIB30_095143 [Stylosanthes scabra]|uniref:Uncharacterized protein n=1 Tax=Stylosanthes scabra TaxID=79078 RepID=A0ABU6QUY9_9FABA|nr:hypothetical protein [Stylosanthes scabra]
MASLGILGSWYYPRFVAATFTTIFIQEDSDEDEGKGFALGFRLGGRKYKFTLAALATSWGLKNEGDIFKGGSYPLGTWNEFSKEAAMRDLRLDYATSEREADSLAIPDGTPVIPLFTGQGWFLPRARAPMDRNIRDGAADLSREEVVAPGSANIITYKNIDQMQRNLVGQADAAGDAGEEVAGDMPMPDTQPQPTIGTSSQVPTETEVPPQEQSEVIEFVRRGFEEMQMMMSDGFARFSKRMDSLDTHMASQDVDIRSLKDEFRKFKGEDVVFDPPEHQDGALAQD